VRATPTRFRKRRWGLRSSVTTARASVQVSQRHKRFSTILDKLAREPSMKLSRMQDIGGCRAVLPDMDAIRAVQRLLERRTGYVRTADYIETPRSSGYRAVHVMLKYDERVIEVQLRTKRMHEWAIAVERLGGRLSLDFKSGKGPVEILDFFRAVSTIDHYLELGASVTDEMRTAASAARTRVLGLITELEANQ
jgi:putative GTP pyrophosphokinase